MEREKRARTRIPLHFDTVVEVNGKKVSAKTFDLSMRGIQCSPDPEFKAGRTCRVVFILSPEIRFKVEAVIARASGDKTGFFFVSMGEDSFYHLKKLVQYNSNDPDKIENEMATPVKNRQK